LVKVARKGIVGQDRLLGSTLKTKGGCASNLSRRVRKCFVVEFVKCENGTLPLKTKAKATAPKKSIPHAWVFAPAIEIILISSEKNVDRDRVLAFKTKGGCVYRLGTSMILCFTYQ